MIGLIFVVLGLVILWPFLAAILQLSFIGSISVLQSVIDFVWPFFEGLPITASGFLIGANLFFLICYLIAPESDKTTK